MLRRSVAAPMIWAAESAVWSRRCTHSNLSPPSPDDPHSGVMAELGPDLLRSETGVLFPRTDRERSGAGSSGDVGLEADAASGTRAAQEGAGCIDLERVTRRTNVGRWAAPGDERGDAAVAPATCHLQVR